MKKVLVVLTLVFVVSLAFACHGEMKGEGMKDHMNKKHMKQNHGMMQMMMLEKLDLSETQKEKIEDLHLAHKKMMISQNAELETLQLDKHTAMRDMDFNKAKKINDKIFNLKKKLDNARIDLKAGISAELTKEQLTQAKEMRKMHSKKMMKKQHQKKGEGCGQNKGCK